MPVGIVEKKIRLNSEEEIVPLKGPSKEKLAVRDYYECFDVSVDGSRDFAWIPSQFLVDEYFGRDELRVRFFDRE